ncbi:MAG: site-2 protease family protein [Candidatus Altiarchaeales archaeon]|nr:site-2 protease family protein [Candidatus Altiarchaeota archaeon]MCG2781995.1 site-2 protease family protein [Candidatus Altiarchaeales archaeon]MBU4267131.1 site-2 protease family protein [Candidatus Altiarchaeota archaeon]MBU4342170.1 site-2 protease family protein [Candidatus Altiarchaeota archaeon]MBU4406539.1 site-2 protease family protein [Candidatus Altiarchaeota archaeon]
MNFWVFFWVAFFAGTYFLWKKKVDRYFIVFMIRTKYFLRIIDRIALAAPWLWKFLADCAVVFSFSGVGIAYLSRYRKLSKSLNLIFILLGILAIVGLGQNPVISIAMFAALIAITVYLERNPNQKMDFLFGSLLISVIFLRIPTLVISLFGYYWQLPLWLAVLEGVFGIIPLLIGAFVLQGYQILFLGSSQAGIAPAIPGEQGGEVGLIFYGTGLFIPIVYALIALTVTVVSHELAHGILARVYKLKLKSTGIVTLGIIPIGAFVEPDEKKMDKRPSIEKMHVFAAGSFANFLVAVVSAFLMLFSPTFIMLSSGMVMNYLQPESEGILIASASEGYPAYGVLDQGTIVYEIDNESVGNANLFTKKMGSVKPGDNITLKTNRGIFAITAAENPDEPGGGFMGISWLPYNRLTGFILPLMNFLFWSFFWIFFININISLVNVLPMAPFDGWRMLKEVMLTFDISELATKRFVKGVLVLMIVLLLVNTLPLFSSAFNSVLEILF